MGFQKDGCVKTSHMEQYVAEIQRNAQVCFENEKIQYESYCMTRELFMIQLFNFETNWKFSQSDIELSIAAINDIIIKYNTTTTTTCNRKIEYAQFGMNLVYLIAACVIIILLILLIFILIRWWVSQFKIWLSWQGWIPRRRWFLKCSKTHYLNSFSG